MSKGRFVIALTGDLFISYSDKMIVHNFLKEAAKLYFYTGSGFLIEKKKRGGEHIATKD